MVFTLVLAGAVLVPPSLKLAAATPTPKRFQIQAQSRTVSVPYLSNVDLDVGSEAITRAIIPIHGLGSDPNGIYNRVRNAAQKIPGMTEKALILAPQMLERGEISGTIDEDLVYWWWNPYWGSERVLVGPSEVSENLSSFTVLDQMIDHLLKASLFPNLEDIVIIGFSAGGQLVHRYAVSSPKETQARATRDIHFRYVVMSPSSYVYLDNKRAISGTTDTFAIFDGAGCGSFNSYGYGLNNLYSYHSENGMTPALMRQQYEKRFVFYLTGEADNNPNDSGLDKRCQALLEGAHRLERAVIFFNYVQDLYGPSILDRQNLQTVPGIGHSDALIESAQGMK
ncbi:MAG: hypothetical protein KJT03_23355, partial [Verrucomicrobiae bacterium]|nr:hypothetical protein [Verrucomicrobiae bacterium]